MGTLENKNSITLAQFAQTLSAIIGKKDCNIQAHSERVANYSREIAKRHGLSEEEQNNIFVMGLLHDIGKIGISEMILNKPGRLMEMEEEILKRHTLIGEEILKNIKDYPKLASVALGHHERFDGQGYPYGIAGEDIPMEARIVAVADAYDEMTAEKVFAMPLSKEQAKEEIKNGSGAKFDPEFASIMLQIIDEEPN